MRYANARFQIRQRDMAYRIYVTDCLRQTTENTAKYGGGGYITKRFADILDNKRPDNRTAQEIVTDVTKRAGIEVV